MFLVLNRVQNVGLMFVVVFFLLILFGIFGFCMLKI